MVRRLRHTLLEVIPGWSCVVVEVIQGTEVQLLRIPLRMPMVVWEGTTLEPRVSVDPHPVPEMVLVEQEPTFEGAVFPAKLAASVSCRAILGGRRSGRGRIRTQIWTHLSHPPPVLPVGLVAYSCLPVVRLARLGRGIPVSHLSKNTRNLGPPLQVGDLVSVEVKLLEAPVVSEDG